MAITRKQENPGANGVLLPDGQRLVLHRPEREVKLAGEERDGGVAPEKEAAGAGATGLKLTTGPGGAGKAAFRATFTLPEGVSKQPAGASAEAGKEPEQ